ncbi:MAG: hypothetical protein AB8B91_06470 [Rubripirellula sp.]
MNATIISNEVETNPATDNSVVEIPETSMDALVEAICLDASHESLKFVLRSNVGHDGE